MGSECLKLWGGLESLGALLSLFFWLRSSMKLCLASSFGCLMVGKYYNWLVVGMALELCTDLIS